MYDDNDPLVRLLVVSNILDSLEAASQGDKDRAEQSLRQAVATNGYVTLSLMHGMLQGMMHEISTAVGVDPADVIGVMRMNAAEYC